MTDLTKHKRADKTARELKMESTTPWVTGIWTDVHERAFETLKGALLTRPVLVLPNNKHKWRIATDASDLAMGAVLSQIDERGEEHPVAFYSHKISGPQLRWSTWELELAAVVWAVTTVCRNYLRSVKFEIVTDSKVVEAIVKQDVPKRRLNLFARLLDYDFTIVHRSGEQNRNADFFSRWAAYKDWEEAKLLKVCAAKVFMPTHPWFCSSDNEVIQCFAGVVPTVPTIPPSSSPEVGVPDPLPAEDVDNPDFSILRRKIVEEQRKDPKLKQIIARLEAEEVIQNMVLRNLIQNLSARKT